MRQPLASRSAPTQILRFDCAAAEPDQQIANFAYDDDFDFPYVFPELNPTVAVLGYASQCRNALAAEPHRDAFVADRFRVAQHIREFDKLALMRAASLGPELAHDLDILARSLTTTLERDAQSLELFCQPSDADAEGEPPPLKRSTVATVLASTRGLCSGTRQIPVASRILVVQAAA
jgi:hypothetical protein